MDWDLCTCTASDVLYAVPMTVGQLINMAKHPKTSRAKRPVKGGSLGSTVYKDSIGVPRGVLDVVVAFHVPAP